jgi:hypothetical protein
MSVSPEAYERLLQVMRGIASCATDCECCRMHQRIAEESVREVEMFPREHACKDT